MPVTDPHTVLEHLSGQEGAMTAFLEDLVRAESPSDDPESQQAVLEQIGGALTEIGFVVRHYPGKLAGGHLYARPRRREHGQPVQLLIGHSDTVWPVGTLEKWEVQVQNGRLCGPGSFDMKAGLMQIVFALRALHELGLEPAVAPVVFVNSDEEIGSKESRPRIRRLARVANRAFVLEPALGPSGQLKTARKGGGRFTVSIEGRSAHAGLDPGAGASAIVELAHVIHTLHALNDVERGISVNVGTIEGGNRPNVVAAASRAVVDVRVRTMEDARYVEEQIHQLVGTTPGVTVQVEGAITRLPMEPTPRNRVLWRQAQEAGRELGLELEEATAGGASDGNETSLFCATLDGLGAVGDGAHAHHEHVELRYLAERTALLVLLLMADPVPDTDMVATTSAASESA
jgi:glutamate carboxypeptidase